MGGGGCGGGGRQSSSQSSDGGARAHTHAQNQTRTQAHARVRTDPHAVVETAVSLCTKAPTPRPRSCTQHSRGGRALRRWRPLRPPSQQVGGWGRGQSGSPEGPGPTKPGTGAQGWGSAPHQCFPSRLPVHLHTPRYEHTPQRLFAAGAALRWPVQLPPAPRRTQVHTQLSASPHRPRHTSGLPVQPCRWHTCPSGPTRWRLPSPLEKA